MVHIRVIKGPIDTQTKGQGENYFNTFMPSYFIKLPNGRIVTSEDSFIDEIDIENPIKRVEHEEKPLTA